MPQINIKVQLLHVHRYNLVISIAPQMKKTKLLLTKIFQDRAVYMVHFVRGRYSSLLNIIIFLNNVIFLNTVIFFIIIIHQ